MTKPIPKKLYTKLDECSIPEDLCSPFTSDGNFAPIQINNNIDFKSADLIRERMRMSGKLLERRIRENIQEGRPTIIDGLDGTRTVYFTNLERPKAGSR